MANTVLPLMCKKILTLAVLLAGLLVLLSVPVNALSGDDFNAGNIIDDAVFFNEKAISPTQIQNFLKAKVPICDTNGQKPIYGQTRAEYGASRGNPAPYTCLKDFKEDVAGVVNGGSDLCTKSIAAGTKTAAEIIYDVGQACGINPQVLIVLLQKEQSLITDDWPWQTQYNKATGYGCPDTAPCNELYYGFFNQVYNAAKAFRRYEANPTSYNYRASRNNYVHYHPNLSGCSGSSVFITNQATANLYIYTPYQPNQAALNNLYGTGDSCSAYGNRNFWRLFNDWFGSTRAANQFVSMKTPRVLTTETSLQKMDLTTSQPVGNEIAAGTELYFDQKIYLGGTLYLRSSQDTATQNPYVIRYSDLQELSPSYEPMAQPRWMHTANDLRKLNPVTLRPQGSTIAAGTKFFAHSKTTILGKLYIRTGFDAYRDNHALIPYSTHHESEIEPEIVSFSTPRWLESKNISQEINLKTMSKTTSTIPSDRLTFFDKKVTLNNKVYITNPEASLAKGLSGFPLSDFRTFRPDYKPMVIPRTMKLASDTEKLHTITFTPEGTVHPAGLQISFSQKMIIDDKLYLRSSHDVRNDFDKLIPFDILKEL